MRALRVPARAVALAACVAASVPTTCLAQSGPAGRAPLNPPAAATPPNRTATPVWREHLGTKFAPLALDDALAKADPEFKLVVVFVFDSLNRRIQDEIAHVRATTWQNPTLSSYLDWRCVPIEIDAAYNGWVMSRLRLHRRDLPAVVVLRPLPSGEEFLEKITREWNPLSAEIDELRTPANMQDTVPDIVPMATTVLLQVDFARERLAAREPQWAAASDRINPPPDGPPPADPLYQVEDKNATAVPDPPPDDRGWRAGGKPVAPTPLFSRTKPDDAAFNAAPYDVMERLAQARAAIEARDARGATGLYTWIWERSEDLDPASRAFRRRILPDELHRLASINDLTKARFGEVRDRLSRRLLYVGYSDLMLWFTLNEVCGDDAENIQYLDLYTNDRDEAAMMPRATFAAFRIMSARDKFIDPWHIDAPARPGSKSGMPSDADGAALAHIRAVAKRLAETRSEQISPADFDNLQAFRRGYLIDETTRLHAALLRAGRDTVARDAVDVALKALPDGRDRAQLLNSTVFCALATDQPRPELHARYLADAAAIGYANLTLELRLKEARPGQSGAGR